LPNSTSSASGFLRCSWMTRASGRAPNSGRSPSRQPAARAVDELDEDLAVGELDLELGHELVDHAVHALGPRFANLMIASRRLRNSGANIG
jgi:hypothetical protein